MLFPISDIKKSTVNFHPERVMQQLHILTLRSKLEMIDYKAFGVKKGDNKMWRVEDQIVKIW